MATLDQFISQAKNFLKDVEEVYPDTVAESAITAASLIQNRIQETGIGSDGSQLGEYTNDLYKQKRAARGLPTSYVNLDFTGDMWRDIKLIEVKTSRGLTTAKIGAQFQENDDKLFYNSIRYDDDILAVTSEEEEELAEILNDGLQALVNLNFD